MTTADPTYLPLRRGYADTSFGQLHYAEQGNGPALLLLHQTPRSHDEFREVQPLLAAAGHRTIAMDMLGFGQSPTLVAPQTIEQFASGALALLDALDIEEAAVLGHHTGGAVAVELGAAAPERIRGLVLSSAPWVDEHYRSSHAGGPGVDEAVASPDGSHLTTLWALRAPYYPERDRAALLDRFIRDALSPGVDPAEGHMACARYVMEDRIGLVTAPTMLLGADADPVAFPAIEPLCAHLRAASRVEVRTIAGGTIPLMEQEPDAVAAHVLPFLATVWH